MPNDVRLAEYAKPPIVEAILELRLRQAVDSVERANQLASALNTHYDPAIEHRDVVGGGGQFAFIKSRDGTRLIGCGPDTLSFHVLAPYPGWARLISDASAVMALSFVASDESAVRGVGVRYVDKIRLPTPGIRLQEYFTTLPVPPEHMPTTLRAFRVTTQAYEDEERLIATVTIASDESATRSEPAIIYDIAVRRSPLEPDGKSWRDAAEELHARQRLIFESSITDATRSLFR